MANEKLIEQEKQLKDKYEQFLELLKNNPKAIEYAVVKKSYKELLNIAFEKAKNDRDCAENVVPELLKLGILGKEDKEYYKKLLDIAFEKAKSDHSWAENVVPELLKLGILGKEEIKESYKELLDIAFEKAKSNAAWAEYVVPELLKLGILGKEDKEYYKKLLDTAFEEAKRERLCRKCSARIVETVNIGKRR